LPDGASVSGRIHAGHSRCSNASRGGRFLKQAFERKIAFPPGKDPISQSMRASQERGLTVKTGSLGGFSQSCQGVVAMAAGVRYGKRIKLTFRDLYDASSRGKEVADELPMSAGRVSRKRNRGEPSPETTEGARHGPRQLQAVAREFP
jgi:hypothetical protein